MFKHILVPTDFGACADHALDVAVRLATELQAKVTLMHAFDVPTSAYALYTQSLSFPMDDIEAAARKALEGATIELKKRLPSADGVLRSGEAIEQILATCQEMNIDLIVIGTHGRRGVSRVLLGSVAEKTVRLASVPVLTVPAKGHDATTAGRTNR